MTLSTYIWQRLVLIGATLFDNFFLWSLKVHALKCTFRHPKIQILYYMYLWETSGVPERKCSLHPVPSHPPHCCVP